MSAARQAYAGQGRIVHRIRKLTPDHWRTACGMGGRLGYWLQDTKRPVTCKKCLRAAAWAATETDG